MAITITINILQGTGTVHIYKNGIVVATATSTTPVSTTYNTGDTNRFVAVPPSGTTLIKVCSSLSTTCNTNPPLDTGTMTVGATAVSFTASYYFGTSTSPTITRTVEVFQGSGTVNVYKNNILIGTATSSTPKTFSLIIGDSYYCTATPSAGYTYQKYCWKGVIPAECYTLNSNIISITSSSSLTGTMQYYFIVTYVRTASVKTGNGEIDVYLNNRIIGTAKPGIPYTYTATVGDTWEYTAYPDTGYFFEKFCETGSSQCWTTLTISGTFGTGFPHTNTVEGYFCSKPTCDYTIGV